MEEDWYGRTDLPDRALKRLIKSLPTPFFLYDEDGIRRIAQELFAAFSWNPGYREYFPVRLNCNPAILRLMHEEHAGLLCTSRAELILAARCGFSGEQILYAPLRRDDAAERMALDGGAVWLLDGPWLLPSRPPEKVILTLHPGGKLRMDGRTLGCQERSKFGMDETALRQTARTLADLGVQRLGIALRAESNELDADYYPAAAERLFRCCAELQDKADIRVCCCLLGDGLGASYRPEYREPGLPECGERIAKLAREILEPSGLGGLALFTALGRRLIVHQGLYVMRAIAVKQRERPLILADGSCGQLMRTTFLGSYRRLSVLGGGKRDRELCDVTGCSADDHDRFAESRLLPPVRTGDFLILHDVGAGCCTAAGCMTDGLPCAEYLLDSDKMLRPIGRACQAEDFVDWLLRR